MIFISDKYGLTAGLCFLALITACKTIEFKPKQQIIYVSQVDRPDWKAKIDRGEVGYYDASSGKLIGLDSPPRLAAGDSLITAIDISKKCQKYLNNEGNNISRIEFFVTADGVTEQFFILESAGACDEALARSYYSLSLIPGKKNNQPIPVLVHVEMSG